MLVDMKYLRDEDSKADNSLAEVADRAALVLGVVVRLGSKSREPDDGEGQVNHQHRMDIGESSCTVESGGHDEEHPCRYS